MEILVYVFWGCVFLLVYPYIGYPIILNFSTKLFSANGSLKQYKDDWPTVSIIISAYNEEKVINEKLQNTIELDYPKEKLEVIVVSDASEDSTDDIIRRWVDDHKNIKLLRQDTRRGKSAGLNLAVDAACGDIIVFSDANAMYEKNAVFELVKYFANADIGYVMGAALYNSAKNSEAAKSEGLYWRYEVYLKKLESEFYSVVGGDGAIYAIRKELFWNLDDDDINDFVNPLQIVSEGYRGFFNLNAVCYEAPAGEFRKEFARKRRIVNRSWRAILKHIKRFHILRHFRFLFQLISHKIIRWFSLFILFIVIISNILLVIFNQNIVFTTTLIGIILTIGLAAIGYYFDEKGKPIPKLVYILYYFYLVNLAATLGIYDNFKGRKYVYWSQLRE